MSIGRLHSYRNLISDIRTYRYVYISTSTTVAGDAQILKYDLDGNLVTSKTYAQMGSSTSRQIGILNNDQNYLFWCRGTNESIANIRTNSNLESITTATFRISDFDLGMNNLFIANSDGLQFRNKSWGSVGTSVTWSTTSSKLMTKIKDRDYLIWGYNDTVEPRRYTINSAEDTWTQSWVSAFMNASFVYIDLPSNQAILMASTTYRVINLTNGNIISNGVSLPIGTTGTKHNSSKRLSNGDLILGIGSNLVRVGLVSGLPNSAIWTRSMPSTVNGIVVDQEDNIYVSSLGTSGNRFRKYDKDGNSIWEKTPTTYSNMGLGISEI
jgi:hypothetical protein